MHELGHIILNTLSEHEADLFASHILAPRIIMYRNQYKRIDVIGKAFGLSQLASNKAFSDYQDWFFRISQQPAPHSPSKPELLLEKLFFPKQKKTKPAKPVAIPKTATATVQAEYNDSISDKQLFEHLKNSHTERSKAAGLGLSIDEYIKFKYSFQEIN